MRVVLAEDSVLLREGIARIIDEAGIEVVGQAGDAEDLLRKVRAHKPDVAITDIRMPPSHTDEGLRAAQEIRGELPEIGVLVLSQYDEEGYALLTNGYQPLENLLDPLERWWAAGAPVKPQQQPE